MAKAFTICIVLLSFSISVFARSECSSLRKEVIETYRSQIGVREVGGNNKGPEIKKYLALCGLPEGFPWCAALVTFVNHVVGLDYPSGSCGSYNWFKTKETYYMRGKFGTFDFQIGDVFGLFYRSLGRIGHIGWIDGEQGDYIITVEGNTNAEGSREGDVVARKRRHKRTIYAAANWID